MQNNETSFVALPTKRVVLIVQVENQRGKMPVIEIFCWTRTLFLDTLTTLLGENLGK